MKKCPYCAEEIQDEAVRCRFCGADQRPEAPTVAGIVFTHLGFRYMLGITVTRKGKPAGYGIWDRSVAGAPIERFDYSEPGWDEAWGRFAGLEPAARENPEPPACPWCGGRMQLQTGADRTAAMARGFVLAGGVGALLASGRGRFKCMNRRCGLTMG